MMIKEIELAIEKIQKARSQYCKQDANIGTMDADLQDALLLLRNVSHRRELLIDFELWLTKNGHMKQIGEVGHRIVDAYIKSINCG